MIEFRNISRVYQSKGKAPVHALRNVNLQFKEHGFTAITGPSGCGKSTLLHLLGALDSPSSGELFIGGLALHDADEKTRTLYRRRDTGIVFQFFNLMPTLTVMENVTLPLLLQGISEKEAKPAAGALLELVGLSGRHTHFHHQLSGGEMQRTAIARALVHKPKLLIADEPTGNLDSKTAAGILELFQDIHSQKLTTLVVVTHSEDVAGAASRRVRMEDGQVTSVPT